MRGLRPGIVCRAFAIAAIVALTGCQSPEERAQSYYEKGMALIAKKDDLNARLDLLNAVKFNSDKVEAWRALAGIDERTKAQQALFTDLRRVVELDPKDLDARLKLARILVAGGATDVASTMLDAANGTEKPNAELHALRAMILAKTNDPAGALKQAQDAMAIDPTNVDAVAYVAARKASDNDFDGALKLLDTVHPDADDQARIDLERLQVLLRKKDLPKAEVLLRQLVAKDPKQARYRDQLIQVLLAEHHVDDAEKEFKAKIAADPTNTKAELDYVRFLSAVKGIDAARTELETRIKAGGDVFDYQIALAQLEVKQGKVNDALELLQTLVKSASTPVQKAAAQLNIAAIDVEKRDVTAAEPVIADILAVDRRNIGALRLRASIKIGKGDVDGAIADLREALNDQPKSAELLLSLATAYERAKKPELAERAYADAFKASDRNPAVALQYVGFLQRKGDLSHAEDVLVGLAGRNPANVQILSSLAQIRLMRKNWTGALAVADAVARLGDKAGIADQIRAAALAGENKIDESVSALEDAHRANPDALGPIVALVSGYLKEGQSNKAMSLLDDMNKKFPNNAQLLVLRGQALAAQNKEDEAISSMKAAIAAQPKQPVGYAALYENYAKLKNFDAAIDVVKAALQQLPDNLAFRLALGGLEVQKGDNEAAITLYESILKDNPKVLVATNNLASLLLDHRSDKDSLNRALALSEQLKDSNVPQFEDTFGWAQYKRGDYKMAISILENAVAKNPKLAALHYHLGMSYKADGQNDKAQEQLKTAFNLERDETPLKQTIRAAMNEAADKTR